jgi:hypothetical protein
VDGGCTPSKGIDERYALSVYYSRIDFFCEGQESNPAERETSSGKKKSANEKNDRFYGHFNTFF